MIADHVLRMVSRETELTRAQIVGPRRWRYYSDARAVAAQLLRGAGWSLPRIGRALKKHHTSILAALRLAERRPDLAEIVARLRAEIDACGVHQGRSADLVDRTRAA